MHDTLKEWDAAAHKCRSLYEKKLRDYGTAWRILRLTSLTDQLFIKAQRLRSIEEKGTQKVADSTESEYIGIVNYSLMALIQMELGIATQPDLDAEKALSFYDHFSKTARNLMEQKNHDYGEAWREMRISSLTDMILQKILRIKQIENNRGTTLVSEGVAANYLDMVNYALFALIRLGEASADTP
jgi:hypothetical protein